MPTSVLVTGASGYIGGTILDLLLNSKEPWTRGLKISALARKEDHVTKIKELGVEAIPFDGFDDTAFLRQVAADFDVVVHAGAGWHVPSSKALILGQGDRRQRTGKDVHYFQIAGTSNMSDRPHTRQHLSHPDQIFSDVSSIYHYEKYRESMEPYHQRTSDITVVETGLATGVKTYLVMAPYIFGIGTGPINKYSLQIPSQIAAAKKDGHVGVFGKGETIWDHVHILDVSELFVLLIGKALAGEEIPVGEKGIYFAETGFHRHREFSQLLAEGMRDAGLLASADVKEWSMQEVAEKWAGGSVGRAELAFGSNSRTKADLASKLGWTPSREHLWSTTFREEVAAMEENPSVPKEIHAILAAKH